MAHPGVCLPITAVALVAAVTAAWFRIVDVSVLERFSAEGLDLRLVAIAFGLVGAIGASQPGPEPTRRTGWRRVATPTALLSALVGVVLILLGLARALI